MFNRIDNSDRYTFWLSDIIGGAKYHSMTLQTLLDIEFYSNNHEMDKNRMSDAIALRRSYIEKNKIQDDKFYYTSPSVLEVLIALIVRIENDILSEENNISSEYLFNMFLENLNIDFIYDWDWNDTQETYIRERVSEFLDRKYNPDGSNGNIFVINNPPKDLDLRKKDIWTQLQWWLREKIM